jgi:dTMP kinase
LLVDWLQKKGLQAISCADPGGTAVGDIIRNLLLDHRQQMALPCEAFLFMASRAQLVAQVIRPALAAGQVVVADRFLLANVVYQGHAGGLNPDELWQVGLLATGGLEPDLTFVLDLPAAAAQDRRTGVPDRLESRELPFHVRVRDGFLTEARRRPDRIRIIDANGPVEEIHQRICRQVASLLPGICHK